jgi:hypothetical protein
MKLLFIVLQKWLDGIEADEPTPFVAFTKGWTLPIGVRFRSPLLGLLGLLGRQRRLRREAGALHASVGANLLRGARKWRGNIEFDFFTPLMHERRPARIAFLATLAGSMSDIRSAEWGVWGPLVEKVKKR